MANTLDDKLISVINQKTPMVSVYSNQGLMLRELRYYRRLVEEKAKVCITVQRYDNLGQLKCSIDPRLSVSYLEGASSVTLNQQQQNTLNGIVLKSKNVDSGTQTIISNVRGKVIWSTDSRETEREFEYDKLGRLEVVYEKAKGNSAVCSERFVYGDKELKKVNGINRLIKHYDTAGLSPSVG